MVDVEMKDMHPTTATEDLHEEGEEEEEEERDCQREMKDMEGLSDSVKAFSDRCQGLHKIILEFVRTSSRNGTASSLESVAKADMEMQLHSFQSKLQDLEVQLQELAKARDEANERERRVRRGLYRVATGRLDIGEVLKVNFCYFLCRWQLEYL
jgi:DNA-directed RNA polymerase specialized sigma subunit